MSKIIVKNSGALRGEIAVSGSKNSALPIIAACILTPGKNTIESVPSLSDIGVMFHILERLGAKINMGIAGVEVDCTVIKKFTAPYELVGKMRGSFLLAGPLLARLGRARHCYAWRLPDWYAACRPAYKRICGDGSGGIPGTWLH